MSFNGNNSVLDARSYSLTGQNTPRPGYNRLQSTITVGGPFQIPSLFRNGSFNVAYSRIQNRNASLQTMQMPTAAERSGDFSASSRAIVDPLTGTSFAGNVIPEDRISPQAKALIDLYPLPNFSGGRYNYQIPLVGVTHGDNLSGQISNFTINNANRLSGTFGIQSTRSDNPDVFGFTDTVNSPGANGSITWIHRFSQRVSGNIRYQFARTVTQTLPYFGTRLDISGIAGILGNDRDPRNWGPPALNFPAVSRGCRRDLMPSIATRPTLSDTRARTLWPSRFRLWRRLQEAAIQSALAAGGARHLHIHRRCNRQRLRGFPAGNPDGEFAGIRQCRQVFPPDRSANAYVTDDLQGAVVADIDCRRAMGIRVADHRELGRLVNLDIAPGFASATPSVAGSPSNSLVQPDKSGIRAAHWLGVAAAVPASSMVVRAGHTASIATRRCIASIADQMAQQSPLSKSLSVQNTPENPLTLADGFRGSPSVTATTFAIDPDFRVGNCAELESLDPAGSALGDADDRDLSRDQRNACAAAHAAEYVSRWRRESVSDLSDGVCLPDVERQQQPPRGHDRSPAPAAQRFRGKRAATPLRRRSTTRDSAANSIAQNWLDRQAERGLSNFDQRHAVSCAGAVHDGNAAPASGFWDGWRGTLFKEWTLRRS